jgi:hypothetical protein
VTDGSARAGEPRDQHEVDDAVTELETGPPFDDEDRGGATRGPRQPMPAPRRSSRGSSSILAAAMLGLRDVLEGPQKETIVIQAEAPGEPPDVDRVGLQAELDDGRRAVGPPLDDLKEKAEASRRAARSRRRRQRS